jgi:hypothetical protein
MRVKGVKSCSRFVQARRGACARCNDQGYSCGRTGGGKAFSGSPRILCASMRLPSRGSASSAPTCRRRFATALYIDDMRASTSAKKVPGGDAPIAKRCAFVGHLMNAENTAAVIELFASMTANCARVSVLVGQVEASLTAWIETHRGLEMLYRQVCLTGEQTQPTTPIPAVGKARIERESPIDQGESGIDVLAEMPEHQGGTAENPGVVGGGAKCPPSEIDGHLAVLPLRYRRPQRGQGAARHTDRAGDCC